jgi:hypothetical protein
MPKNKYPSFTDMLAIASKTLNSNKRVTDQEPKKTLSTTKLSSLPNKNQMTHKKSLQKNIPISKKVDHKEKMVESKQAVIKSS